MSKYTKPVILTLFSLVLVFRNLALDLEGNLNGFNLLYKRARDYYSFGFRVKGSEWAQCFYDPSSHNPVWSNNLRTTEHLPRDTCTCSRVKAGPDSVFRLLCVRQKSLEAFSEWGSLFPDVCYSALKSEMRHGKWKHHNAYLLIIDLPSNGVYYGTVSKMLKEDAWDSESLPICVLLHSCSRGPAD